MFDITLKSRKILASFFCLSLSFVLIASCAAPLITLGKITTVAGTVLDLIEITEKILYLTSNSVNSSYEDLGENIRSDYFVVNKRFSDDIIENMEAQHKDLLSKHKQLDNSINKTNKAANELFSMLKTRANQSTITD